VAVNERDELGSDLDRRARALLVADDVGNTVWLVTAATER
jgi:hypothetical protein